MAEDKAFGKKVESESRLAKPVGNENLTCSDCIYKFDDTDPFLNGTVDEFGVVHGPVTMCYKYEHKPQSVLDGGDCSKKVQE